MKRNEKIIFIIMSVLALGAVMKMISNETMVSTLPATGANMTPLFVILGIALAAIIIYIIIRIRSKNKKD